MTRGWEWADSWLLMGLAPEPQPLEDVIARMDALNHAIPGREELEVGLSWLVGAGLAAVDDQQYQRTPRGHDLVETAAGGTRSWHTAWGKVEAVLKSQPKPTTLARTELPQSEYDRAIAAYQEMRKEH